MAEGGSDRGWRRRAETGGENSGGKGKPWKTHEV